LLFPDERIRRDRKQLVPVVKSKRPQVEKFAFQMWLKIECHRNHESTRIPMNSNLGSARGSRAGDGVLAIANFFY